MNKLKVEHNKIKKQETKLSIYSKDLNNKKKIINLKLLAREQINNLFIPWSLILEDLASKVPKNVIVLDIDKLTSSELDNNKKVLNEDP